MSLHQGGLILGNFAKTLLPRFFEVELTICMKYKPQTPGEQGFAKIS